MILSSEKLRAICGISASVGAKSDILERCIEQAEDFDIKSFLGNSFFTAIDKNKASYSLLLSGGEYTYNGVTYSFKGLQYAIAWFAFARWTRVSNSQPTAFGTVVKNADSSDPVTERELATKAKEYKSCGLNYLMECKNFLELHKTDTLYYEYYLLGTFNETDRKPNFQIDVIG